VADWIDLLDPTPEEVREHGGVKHAVGELLTCPFCLAQWVGTAFVFGYATAPRATRLAALTMTTVAGSDVLTRFKLAGGLISFLGVAIVVLLRFHVGSHILWRHQSDVVPLVEERPAEVVRAAAGLHRHHAGGQSGREFDHPVPR